jgi:predicted histidine transporter YuiF (NhaC family)
MTATNEQLVEAFLTMSSLIAGLLEMDATIAEIVIPLASNLTEEQKAALSYSLNEGRKLAAELRESAIELRQS